MVKNAETLKKHIWFLIERNLKEFTMLVIYFVCLEQKTGVHSNKNVEPRS